MGKRSRAPDRAVEASARQAPTGRTAAADLDLRGEVCPYTFLKARLALESMEPGARLRVVVDNPTSARDVPRSLAGAGHRIVGVEEPAPGVFTIVVAKHAP